MSLIVVHDREEDLYNVVDTFDGKIVEQFYTRTDAEDFAWAESAIEDQRIYNEFG